ncbi:Hypothetical predicted protein [Cloeon dipterum]|uniref:C-type lectin domain-containing protein n=1 Tax=Cloeon dipterum TaxID=197152 RepID=A0A8S1DWQ1_9INSE|nr:Hypothetical predicted protein [Cloeon dipterum]
MRRALPALFLFAFIAWNAAASPDEGTRNQQRSSLDLVTLANGKKYYFYASLANKKTWYEAKEFCEAHNMHLASPKTQEEIDLLYPAADNVRDDFWLLSASDAGQAAGEFKWHDNSSLPRDSALWNKDDKEPNNFGKGHEVCAYFHTNHGQKLLDYNCDFPYRCFICQLPN